MSVTRRQFLGGAASIAVSASMVSRVARAANAPFVRGKPRALVQIFLRGGIDSILMTDPKRKVEVASNIDVPYAETDILRIGGVSVGPCLRDLERFLPRLTILNGVVGSTVSHETGEENIVEMRRVFPVPIASGNRHGGQGLVGALGMLRGGDAPLSDVRLNYAFDAPSSRSLVANGSFLSKFSGLFSTEERRSTIDRALSQAAASASPATRRSYDAVRTLARHWPNEPLPTPSTKLALEWGTILRDALFVLRHRLAPCVFIYAPREGAGFDSHVENLGSQKFFGEQFVRAFSYFLEQLATMRTADGVPLAEEVGVLVSSELGRFPVINAFNGKDHFPEFPIIMTGPGLRPGQYGETDKQMIATPISAESGRPRSSARDFVPSIDDVGKTIFDWFGVEDTAPIGYVGRRLDFLLA